MAHEFIRLWVEEDMEKVGRHLLIVGESFSDCGNCRQLGLDFASVKSCPQCKTDFKYVTSRHSGGGAAGRFRWLRKIKEIRPELHFLDYDDFERNMARRKAKDLLG